MLTTAGPETKLKHPKLSLYVICPFRIGKCQQFTSAQATALFFWDSRQSDGWCRDVCTAQGFAMDLRTFGKHVAQCTE